MRKGREMDRVIKFRAFDGTTMYTQDWCHFTFGRNEQKEAGKYWSCYMYGDGQFCCDSTDKKAILMQFTGRPDKDGKEIYEGDIVKMHRFIAVGGLNGVSEGEQEDVGVISIEPLGTAILCDSQENSGYQLHFYGLHEESYEIIGNRFENPELLNQ